MQPAARRKENRQQEGITGTQAPKQRAEAECKPEVLASVGDKRSRNGGGLLVHGLSSHEQKGEDPEDCCKDGSCGAQDRAHKG